MRVPRSIRFCLVFYRQPEPMDRRSMDRPSKRSAEQRSAFRGSPSSGILPNAGLSPQSGSGSFFLVNLLDRRSNLLVTQSTRCATRFGECAPVHLFFDAWVVLPDHMHSLWTLPQRDANFPVVADDQDCICKSVAHRRAAITG